jgi:hypothetical protein
VNKLNSTIDLPQRTSADRNPMTSIAILALWRWRQYWFLLLMICIGMIAAVLIASSASLFPEVMLTGGLRNALRATPTSSEIAVQVQVGGLSTESIQQIYQLINKPFDQNLKQYVSGTPRSDIQTPRFSILSPQPLESTDQLTIYGTSMQDAASHISVVKGRLPEANSTEVEVAVTPETAQLLHLHVGTDLVLSWIYYAAPAELSAASGKPPTPSYLHFHMRVVGIVTIQGSDPFWHGDNFLPQSSASGLTTYYTVLGSEQNLLTAMDQIAASQNISQPFFSDPSFMYWYYRLDPSHISINQLNDLISQLAATRDYMATNFADPSLVRNEPYIQYGAISGDTIPAAGIPSILEKLRSQVAVAQIPAALLALQIFALILIFVSTMTSLLVDRQMDTIILLRRRGASIFQIFGAFMTQSIILSLFFFSEATHSPYVVVEQHPCWLSPNWLEHLVNLCV